jgi:PIN domain nuclease of toxin-antitoxin system
MNLLLDTHTLIWWMEDNPRLGRAARQAIVAAERRCISVVSAWEITIKTSIGRLRLNIDPAESIFELTTRGFQPLPIQFRHAWAVRDLQQHHTDPFDRMLIAQAKCEGLTLVTADEEIPNYGIPVIDASR